MTFKMAATHWSSNNGSGSIRTSCLISTLLLIIHVLLHHNQVIGETRFPDTAPTDSTGTVLSEDTTSFDDLLSDDLEDEASWSRYRIALVFTVRRGKGYPDVRLVVPRYVARKWLYKLACQQDDVIEMSLVPSYESVSTLVAEPRLNLLPSPSQVALGDVYECSYTGDPSYEALVCRRQAIGRCDVSQTCVALSMSSPNADRCNGGFANIVWDPAQDITDFFQNETLVQTDQCDADCYRTTTPQPTGPYNNHTGPATPRQMTDDGDDDGGSGGDGGDSVTRDNRQGGSGGDDDGDSVTIVALCVALGVVVIAVVVGVVVCLYLSKKRSRAPGKGGGTTSSASDGNDPRYHMAFKSIAPPPTTTNPASFPPGGQSAERSEGEAQYDYIEEYASLDETAQYSHEYRGVGYDNPAGPRSTGTTNEYQELIDEAPIPPARPLYHELEAGDRARPKAGGGGKYHELEEAARARLPDKNGGRYHELEEGSNGRHQSRSGGKYHELEDPTPALPKRPKPSGNNLSSNDLSNNSRNYSFPQQPGNQVSSQEQQSPVELSPTSNSNYSKQQAITPGPNEVTGADENGYSLANLGEANSYPQHSNTGDSPQTLATDVPYSGETPNISTNSNQDSQPGSNQPSDQISTPREYLELLDEPPQAEIKGHEVNLGPSVLSFPDRKQIHTKELERVLGPQPPLPRPDPGMGTGYYSNPDPPQPL